MQSNGWLAVVAGLFAFGATGSAEEAAAVSTTPLTRAIRLEKFDEACKLIDKQAVNQPDAGGYHPLTYAAYTGDNQLMETLLKAGADPNVVEANGKTTLYVAANLANTGGMELLHRHGAALPPKAALSPMVAAVVSSSLETVETLLRLYPNIDLQSGWSNGMDSGPRMNDLGDPVSYAAYHGDDVIARFLLAKGVNPKGKDYFGKGALDHAAIHPRCSVELVAELIRAGCSPVEVAMPYTIREIAFDDDAPTTPLDHAAIAGAVGKLNVMVAALDPGKHAVMIRKAALLAAAFRQDEAAGFLYRALGENVPSYSAFLRTQERDELRDEEPSKPADSMAWDDIKRIMPRTTVRKGGAPAAATVAVISDGRMRDAAALLEVELSKNDGIRVVERDAIDAVTAERGLKALSAVDSGGLHESLELIAARNVVVMSMERLNEKEYVRVAVMDSVSGVVAGLYALPPATIAGVEVLADLAASLADIAARGSEQGVAVSITGISQENPEPESRVLARNVDLLLPHLIANTRGCTSLTRDQMHHLELEQAIGSEGSFWAAGWVIDGGLGVVSDGKAKLTLRAIHAVDKKEVRVSHDVVSGREDHGVKKCWSELAERMRFDAGTVGQVSLAKEVELLARHAEWFYHAGDLDESRRLYNACIALGDRDPGRLRRAFLLIFSEEVFTKKPYIRIKRSYYEGKFGYKGNYGGAYYEHPRTASHAWRRQLLESMDDYHRLCELTEAYLTQVNTYKRIAGGIPQELDPGAVGTFNMFVSHALRQLCLFRAITDHAMVASDPAYQPDLEMIDRSIERIARQYVGRLAGTWGMDGYYSRLYRWNTATYLLGNDFGYFPDRLPDVFHDLIGHAEAMFDEEDVVNTTRFDNFYKVVVEQANSARETAGPPAVLARWQQLMRTMQEVGVRRKLALSSPEAIHGLADRNERIAYVEFLCRQRDRNLWSGIYRAAASHHPVVGIVGVDAGTYDQIDDDIWRGVMLEDADSLAGTAEELRLTGAYSYLDWLRHGRDTAVESHIRLHVKWMTSTRQQDIERRWGQESWRRLRLALMAAGEVKGETNGMLRDLAGVKDAPAAGTPLIDLAACEQFVFPPQPGFQHRAFLSVPERSTQVGDELWVPGTYIGERHLWCKGTVETDIDNVIQVVSLPSRKVRTIILPHLTARSAHGDELIHYRLRDRNACAVAVGDDVAYYAPSSEFLFCIRRDNFTVSRVELPQGRIKVMAESCVGNQVAVALEVPVDGAENLEQVVLVEGDRVLKVLASNRRRPALSPADDPQFELSFIDVADGSMILVGNQRSKQRRRIAHAYTPATDKWHQLPLSEVMLLKRNDRWDGADFVDHGPAGLRVFYESLGTRLIYARENYPMLLRVIAAVDSLELDPYIRCQGGVMDMAVSPVESTLFDRKCFAQVHPHRGTAEGAEVLEPGSSYMITGWWLSANELISRGCFRPQVIARGAGHYWVGLQSLDNSNSLDFSIVSGGGMPGLWLVPEETMRAPLLERIKHYPLPMEFGNMPGEDLSRVEGHAMFVEAEAGHAAFRNFDRHIWLRIVGGGHEVRVIPKVATDGMRLMMTAKRAYYDKAVSFRLVASTAAGEVELYNSIKEEIGTVNSLRGGITVDVALPAGASAIRIINDSDQSRGLLIDKLLLTPDEGAD